MEWGKDFVVQRDNPQRVACAGFFACPAPFPLVRKELNSMRIMFFSVSYLIKCFADKYHIARFSFVDDQERLHENTGITAADEQNNFGCLLGCGIFEMTKL